MIEFFDIVNHGSYITCYIVCDGDYEHRYYFKIGLENEYAEVIETDLPEEEFIWRRQTLVAVDAHLRGKDPMPDHITSFWY